MLPRLRILCILLVVTARVQAQPYTLLIKHAYLIDPQSNLHDTLDIAIRADKIERIAKSIPTPKAQKTIDAHGLIICPGLIDIHTHVFFAADSPSPDPSNPNSPNFDPSNPDPSNSDSPNFDSSNSDASTADPGYAGGTEGLHPDSFTFRSGVTTIVDAGSSGWRNFETFKERVIDHSQTRVLAFINIVGAGMRGGYYEQDTSDMVDQPTAAKAERYRHYIVGIKVAHYEGASWHPIDAAVSAGNKANIPVMVDFGGHIPPLSIQQLFQTHLRRNDIFTHCFAQLTDREPLVDPATRTLKPFTRQARQKGIVFDVGYGEISFTFSQALPAIKDGFLPNSLSTDLHVGATHDLLDIMSRFLAMGVDLPTVIRMASWNPAREIGRKELGRLQKGAPADIAILQMQTGHFQFSDHTGEKIAGTQKLECIFTIKSGKIVYRRKSPRF